MKYCIAFLTAILCLTVAQAQKTDVLTYRFGEFERQPKHLQSVHCNGAAIVKITHVNRLLYDVEVSGKSEAFNMTVPEIWTQFMLQTNTSENDSRAPAIAGAPEAPAAVKQALGDMESLKTLMYGLQAIAYSTETDSANVLQKREQWLQTAGFADAAHNSTRSQLGQTIMKRIHDWEEQLKKFDAEFAAKTAPTPADQLEKAQVDVLKATAKGTDYQQLQIDILNLYDLLNPNSFTFTSVPIAPEDNADEVNIAIKISPKAGVGLAAGTNTYQFSQKLFVRHGWKFDFSSGLGLTNLVDAPLALKNVGDSTGAMQIVAEQKNSSNFGLAAFLHAHYRFYSPFSAGISLGVMVDESKLPRYLLGGSALLGRRQRIVLTFGAAYGKVNLLSKTQAVGDLLPSGTTISTVARFKIGFFFGMTFNLTR